jgi:hypothetical protein
LKVGYKIYLVIALILFCKLGNSQIVADTFYIPSYPVPEIYYSDQAPELPEKVMNHRLEYFPQYFYDQDGLPNCGQTSGVFNCMTYEFNRLYNRAADSSTIFTPTYSYNIMCEGNGWYGVSTFDSWNLIMSQGNPTIDIYNEFAPFSTETKDAGYRGQYRMQGYENYEKSFKNRLSGYYSFDVKDDEDLKILMHYFNDHLDGSEHGGTAIFYSNAYFMYTGAQPVIYDTVLCYPNDKVKVFSYISGRPTHSMTLAGYYNNTTIDFNGDGQITDNIDINNDDLVDFHDNERTLWIVINSYGDYWPYSMFLFKYDMLPNVWNKQVFIPVPDTAYQAQLAFKIKMSHTNRNSIKISAGISKDLYSIYPEKIISFPTFNFQGGNHTMTGLDTLAGAETLEFGIDVTDLLKNISGIDDDFARVFLIVENASGVEGSLDFCSVKSLFNGEEFIFTENPYNIEAASTNTFSTVLPLSSQGTDTVLRVEEFEKHVRLTNQSTEFTLSAGGGSGEYTWQLLNTDEYSQEYIIEDYEIPTDLSYNDIENLSFSPGWQIPFGGKIWDSIYIGVNGTISFTEKNKNHDLYPYPPLLNSYYRDYEIDAISGFYFVNNISYAYRSDDEKITVWFNDEAETGIISIVQIYKTGEIKICYPSTSFSSNFSAGIVTGTSSYYSGLRADGVSLHKNTVVFTPQSTNTSVSLNDEGVISIAAQQTSGINSFYVQVTDANGNKASKRIEYETIESAQICEIFPNPVRDNATLKLILEESGTANVEIFNSSGQNISHKQSTVSAGTYYLDISEICADLSPGLYHLRINVGKVNGILRFVKG